jgi:hypothetical protein
VDGITALMRRVPGLRRLRLVGNDSNECKYPRPNFWGNVEQTPTDKTVGLSERSQFNIKLGKPSRHYRRNIEANSRQMVCRSLSATGLSRNGSLEVMTL